MWGPPIIPIGGIPGIGLTNSAPDIGGPGGPSCMGSAII